MNNQCRREQIHGKLPVKENEEQRSDHHRINKEYEVKIGRRNIEIRVLYKFIRINPNSHKGKEEQSCQRQTEA